MNRGRYALLAALAATFAAAGFLFTRDATRWWAATGEAHAALMARSDDSALTEYVRCRFTQPGCWADLRSVAAKGTPFPGFSLLALLGSFFLGVAAVFRWSRPARRLYGDALATREDVADLRTPDWLKNGAAGTSIVIGQHLEVPEEGGDRKRTLRGERVQRADEQMLLVGPGYGERHELPLGAVFGTTRSGKTMHLIAQAVRWTGSFVTLDIKGEIYKFTAGVAAKRSEKKVAFVLSPEGEGHQFDALAELMDVKHGIETAAAIIAEPEKESGNGRYFAEKAAQGIVAAFYAARSLKKPPLDLLHELMLEGGMAPFVTRLMAVDDPDTRLALNAFLDPHGGPDFDLRRALEEGSLTNAWSTMTKALGPFLGREVRWLFRRSDFRARDLLTEKTYVYLRFPQATLKATRRIYDLVVTGLTTGMITYADRALDGSPSVVRVLLLLDELHAAPVTGLPDLLATASSRYIAALFYVQSPAMLGALYGPAGKEGLLENCGVKLFYKSETPSTWRFVSELAGKVSLPERRKSWRGHLFGSGAPTISEGNQSREVLTPTEVDQVGGEKREVLLAKVTGKPLALVRRVDTRPGTPVGKLIARHKPPKIPQADLPGASSLFPAAGPIPGRVAVPPGLPGADSDGPSGAVRGLAEDLHGAQHAAAGPGAADGSPHPTPTQQPLDFPSVEPPVLNPSPATESRPYGTTEPKGNPGTPEQTATLLGGRSRHEHRRGRNVRKVS